MLFLSQAWFDYLTKLNENHPLNLPPSLQALVINVALGQDSFYIKGGKVWQGQDETAPTTVFTDKDTLSELIKSQSKSTLMSAFIKGKLRVEGELSALLSLTAKPSPEFKAFYKTVLNNTQF